MIQIHFHSKWTYRNDLRPTTTSLRLVFLLLIPMLFPTGLHAAEKLGKPHVDKTLGYSIRTPEDWRFVPSKEGDAYIVATFISPNVLRTKSVQDRREMDEHRPEMRVIAFTSENANKASGVSRTGELFGKNVIQVVRINPYKNFKEYVDRTLKAKGTGYYVGETSEGEIDKRACAFCEYILEQHSPPLRRLSCVYHLDDMDIAVYFDIMEEWLPKYERLISQAFDSFRTVEREAPDSSETPGEEGKPLTREQYIEMKTTDLPDGWWHMVSKEHLLISNAKKKFTEKIASFSDAIRKKIASQFKIKKSNGKDEDPRLPVIRVCNSKGEYQAYINSPNLLAAYNMETGEIVCFDGSKEGKRLFNFDWACSMVGRGILAEYLDRAFPLTRPAPWYSLGMSYYYGCFKGKKSSCTYADTMLFIDWLKDDLRTAERSGNMRPFKSLLAHDDRGIQSMQENTKVGTLVCFLKSKKMRNKIWKGLLDKYYTSFQDACAELNKKVVLTGSPKKNGKEEEKKSEDWLKKAVKFQEEARKMAFDDTFKDWDDSDWEKLENAWKDWLL